jgi:hypothetical protein
MTSFVQDAKACTKEVITWTVALDQVEPAVKELKEHFPTMTHTVSLDWDDETMYRLRCVLRPHKK